MTQWYVKELSKLTQVSVQTLHHYDRIKLLVPSIRLANGYRLYSEKDLLKLQQIIALKYFGFGLTQIKTLLSSNVDMVDHFKVQSQFLQEKAQTLQEASKTLEDIVQECNLDKSIPWESIIKLIEVYRMTKHLENTWIGQVLTPAELKDYARFEQDLKNKFSENEQKAFEQQWDDLMLEVSKHVNQDPHSEIGIAFGKRCMAWVNAYYGKTHVALRNAIWEKGLTKVQQEGENAFSPDCFNWLDKAITAYYRDRMTQTLNQIVIEPMALARQAWEDLLTDMHGDEQAPKNAIFEKILNSAEYSKPVKDWLKSYIASHTA